MSDHTITSLIEKLEGAEAYLIASRKHTSKSARYITFWRPERAGYAWPLPWAGRYSADEANLCGDDPASKDKADHSYAVPLSVVEPFMTMPRVGEIDGNAGPVLRNTPVHWAVIEAHALLLRAQSEARV